MLKRKNEKKTIITIDDDSPRIRGGVKGGQGGLGVFERLGNVVHSKLMKLGHVLPVDGTQVYIVQSKGGSSML